MPLPKWMVITRDKGYLVIRDKISRNLWGICESDTNRERKRERKTKDGERDI